MINYYYELVKNQVQMPNTPRIFSMSIRPWELRKKCTKRYAWAIPSPEAIELVRSYFPIYEVGAGTGYWARMATNSYDSEDYYAYDPLNKGYEFNKSWYNIRKKKLKNSNRTLLLCWPPYNTPMAHKALLENKPKNLIYIGEGSGGCTGNDAFHNLLEENYEEIKSLTIPQFSGINDRLWVYKRND